ncbi:sterol-c5-desaturase (erg3 delta-5-desaturase homolog)-like [Plakobranchus ocellatus]|uniref:Sterol-c5-desaturase (Erg3 delta-5-desaturase homolog)-like n=1 Tax=Plakobranchus ocellatus TaxID=259542 RepID=A0AAV3YDH6_9GAST|nr:sterol-c5-desaturase (erg3 delta-5-desaturase homolog)-like [Plakobranchus ocellatus]
MDLVLNYLDHYLFTPYVYPEDWPENNPVRQIISLLLVANIGGYLLYFIVASLSYFFIFDHKLMTHPQILENQILKEITVAVLSVPFMSIPTVGIFFLEVRGYSKLYDNVADTRLGYAGVFLSMFTFIAFTDMCIYWIHRFLHHRLVYRHLHKLHHKWKIPTPFASHAFHPVDGFLQSLPYHMYPFIFPLHKLTYLGLFVFVNIWTVSIHDGDYRVPTALQPLINGSAHHTDHHLLYNYNYGQFFTLWDRIGGSFRSPNALEGCGPMDTIKALEREKEAQENVGPMVNGHAKKEL